MPTYMLRYLQRGCQANSFAYLFQHRGPFSLVNIVSRCIWNQRTTQSQDFIWQHRQYSQLRCEYTEEACRLFAIIADEEINFRTQKAQQKYVTLPVHHRRQTIDTLVARQRQRCLYGIRWTHRQPRAVYCSISTKLTLLGANIQNDMLTSLRNCFKSETTAAHRIAKHDI